MPDAFHEPFIGELKMPSGVENSKVSSSLPYTADILSVGSNALT